MHTDWQTIRREPLKSQRIMKVKDWRKAWSMTRDHRDLALDRKAGGTKRGVFHYKELQRNAEKARIFVTSQGLPGMGPHDMQSGDEIYALARCKALVVLCPSPQKGEQRLTVVGLCFVDHWMYERALQGGAAWKKIDPY